MTNDPDFEDDEQPVHALVMNGPSAGGADGVSDLLLELLCALTKLSVHLQEADEAEFKVFAPRLKAFKAGVEALPTAAGPRRRIGFKAAKKTRRK